MFFPSHSDNEGLSLVPTQYWWMDTDSNYKDKMHMLHMRDEACDLFESFSYVEQPLHSA